MLKIRLARTWKKNTPFFRVVLTEHTAACKSGFQEVLGFFNPISKEFKLYNQEAVSQYLKNGAQLTPRVKKILEANKIAL